MNPATVARSRRRRSHATSPAADWSSIAVAGLPVLACCLGGATERWSQGVVIALLGLLIIARPPQVSLGRTFNALLAGLVACAALAFLPARWFSVPDWRTAMVADFAINLPGTVTPQPWLTLDGSILLVAGVCWFYLIASRNSDLRIVRFEARVFAGGIVLLAALCIGLYLRHTTLPFWHNARGFGPFPNRNQTGDLLGISSILVLACGHEDLRRGNKRWIVWLAAFAVLVVAIVLDFSRAGIAILVFGCAAWLAATSLRKTSGVRIAVACSTFLILLAAMLLFGGEALERFHLRGAETEGVSSDFRWLIFRDAFRLIGSSPWPGIGIGNFSSVFAIFRDASLNESRALHPESDWLWLWVECGVAAVVICLAGGIVLVRRAFPLKEGTNQRLRAAALIAAIIFGLHSIVDVSAHRFGTALAGLFVASLALHRPQQLQRSRCVAPMFRGFGLAVLAAGIAWSVASYRHAALPGEIGVAEAKQAAGAANRNRNAAEAISRTTQALRWAPLDWQLYFLRAVAELGSNQPALALEDFRRARFLEPNSYLVPFEEGRAWIRSNALNAVTAWREALRRAGPNNPGIYGAMVEDAAHFNREAVKPLEELRRNRPDLMLLALQWISGEAFDSAAEQLIEQDPDLAKFTPVQKARLFEIWLQKGTPERLTRAVEHHAEWLQFAWRGVARFHASRSDFRTAYELAARFSPRPELPPLLDNVSVDELRRRAFGNTSDYSAGFTLFSQQLKQGRTDDALATIRHFTDDRDCPPYFHFLEAECWAATNNWERAWNAWQQFDSAATRKR